MANRQKRVMFSLGGVLSFGTVLTVAVAVGLPFWVQATVLCRTGVELVNATEHDLDKFLGNVNYGLFHGERVKHCGLGGRPFRFSFFPDLVAAIPVGLHITVLVFCCVLIVFSSVATGFFFYNGLGNPYETLHGPMGLYLWSFNCCACSIMVMVLFGSEVKINRLTERIANFEDLTFEYETQSERYDRCFWLIFLVFIVHILNILLVRLAGFQFPFSEDKESDLNTGAADLMY